MMAFRSVLNQVKNAIGITSGVVIAIFIADAFPMKLMETFLAENKYDLTPKASDSDPQPKLTDEQEENDLE